MTAGLTVVRAELTAYGRHGAENRPDRAAAWPAVTLQLRSPDRFEEIQVNLASVGPSSEDPDPVGYPSIDEHLVAELRTAEDHRCRVADVIVQHGAISAHERPSWISGIFARYPACAVSAMTGADGAPLLGLRDGRMIRLVPRTAVRHPDRVSLACASFVHFWTAAGRPLASLDCATLTLLTEMQSPCRLNVALIGPRRVRREKQPEGIPGLPVAPALARTVAP